MDARSERFVAAVVTRARPVRMRVLSAPIFEYSKREVRSDFAQLQNS